MFFHAVHLLNHPAAAVAKGHMGAQTCALAGATDAGVVCGCSARTLSCPQPAVVGTTNGLKVPLPRIDSARESRAFLKAHPNSAFLHKSPTGKARDPVQCTLIDPLAAAGLPGCPNQYAE
uniref:Uncharacterized protein n=1 Tax=Hemiselmis andersenii TaxID=464988 RepID=A0A7S0TXI7_HEMAN